MGYIRSVLQISAVAHRRDKTHDLIGFSNSIKYSFFQVLPRFPFLLNLLLSSGGIRDVVLAPTPFRVGIHEQNMGQNGGKSDEKCKNQQDTLPLMAAGTTLPRSQEFSAFSYLHSQETVIFEV